MHAIYTTFFGRGKKKVTKLVLIRKLMWGEIPGIFWEPVTTLQIYDVKRMKHEDRMTWSQRLKKHSVEIDYPKIETASLEERGCPLGKVGIIILASPFTSRHIVKMHESVFSKSFERLPWWVSHSKCLSKAIILIRMSPESVGCPVNHLRGWHSSNLLYLHKH